VSAERKVQQQAPVVSREPLGDVSPEGAVRENAVEEDEGYRRRRAKLGHVKRAGR
jgi:hypothetical protein